MLTELSKNLWSILRHASGAEWEDGTAVRRALRELCEAHELDGAALEVFGPVEGKSSSAKEWRLAVASGEGIGEIGETGDTGWRVEESLTSTVRLVLQRVEGLPPGYLAEREGADGSGEILAGLSRNLAVALASGAQLAELSRRLKAQSFQDNYRVVTMEALYEVGLAIASTLNLDELADGILLRAVSLLDARRGALYLLVEDEGRYRLEGTIGGEAEESLSADDPRLESLHAAEDPDSSAFGDLLPDASHSLVVPIAVDGSPRGLLALADKESRTGIGPFDPDDERALALFANQAAIALENANLHRQALEKERLEREMELAADIQRGILPSSTPDLDDFELLGWNRPTRQVGGDYYGWLDLDDGRTGMVVADVTGKGMPAALLVNTLHSALDLLLDAVEPGVALVERLNDHVVESSRSNKFITMILIVLEPDSGRVQHINAGHNPGVCIRADGSSELLEASGLPLGLLPGSSYRLDTIDLDSGDLICLYSDGITECADLQDEEYGLDRLTAFLAERRTEKLEVLHEQLEADVSAFAQGRLQQDDQTIVLLRRR